MQFDAEKFIQRNAYEQATRKNEVWSIEHVIIDLPGRPIVLAALDVFSRLPVVLDTTNGKPDDIVLKLDEAGRRSAYPEKLWLDHGFEFGSQKFREWADLRGVELIFGARFEKDVLAKRFLHELNPYVFRAGLTEASDLRRRLAGRRFSLNLPVYSGHHQANGVTKMIIYMSEKRIKGMTRRLQKVLRELGVDLKYTQCLTLAVQLLGFDDHKDFIARDRDAPFSPLDEELSDDQFAARDDHQMGVLAAAGLGPVARELLDRCNPTGSWARTPVEEPVWEAVAGNDPL